MRTKYAAQSTEILFLAKVNKDESSGCWNWTAGMKQQGYGQFTADGRIGLVAHRWAYEHWLGPIPQGLVIDHLCRNRRCVNPEHLEAVTQAENMRRWKEAPLSEEEREEYEARRRTRRTARRAQIDYEIPRFFHLTNVVTGGCWLWVGTCNEDGYALFGAHGRRAHRWAYERFIAPIPDGMQIDHLCRVHNCVNPWHLEAVTSRENTLRGQTVTGLNAQKTHCLQGHALEGENLYLYKGHRHCRECGRKNVRANRERIRKDPELFATFKQEDIARQAAARVRKKGRPLSVPNAKKTACIHGHAYTPENTKREPDGSRKCRICIQERLQKCKQ